MPAIHRSYYQVLGVQPDATQREIQRAYRRLARRYHPDLNRGSDARRRFDEVSNAYEVLHDPDLRAGYDRARAGRRERRDVTIRPAANERRDMAIHPAANERRDVAIPPATKVRARAPVFLSRRPPRPVPRFIDDELPWWMAPPYSR
jgi:curved DNA-binding protein CbpA